MTARARAGIALIAVAVACSGNSDDSSNFARGRGLKKTTLAPAAEAAALDAAIRAAFDIDPSLVLLSHSRRLPRTPGYEGGEPVSSALATALREGGLVSGRCEPHHEQPRDTPRCPGPSAGYVVRFSDVFQGAGDTLQLNLAAEKFSVGAAQKLEALRFEKIYQLRREGAGWRVLREARVKDE